MVAPRDASKLNAENFIEEDPYAEQRAVEGRLADFARFSRIVGLSIGVSLMATALATAVALPGGTALAIYPFWDGDG